MVIALLMVAWSQVTITDPLPDLIAASSTKDHVTVREDPTVCGPNPAAVLRTRVGDQYSIAHDAPSCACTVTVTAWPGVLPCTDGNCKSLGVCVALMPAAEGLPFPVIMEVLAG